jgi:HNH endonuclease
MRFWSKVDGSGGPEACWPWTGAQNRGGYGAAWHAGRVRTASRMAWELTNRPIPEGAHVLHRCDNPPCCNPAHLYLGDDAANHADMVGRRRSNAGERNPQARLTWEIAREIRARHAAGEAGYRRLARAYRVDLKTIARVVRGDGWREESKGEAAARLIRRQREASGA